MPKGSVFENNRTQAVRLPAETRFPEVLFVVLHCKTCGEDKFTGRSFEHRRAFIESELLRLG